MKCFLVVLLLLVAPAAAAPDDFTGQWDVSQIRNERGGFPWSREVKYPQHMLLEMRAGHLVGSYTDQMGFSCTFPVVQMLNAGRDLLLANCGETKSPDAYAPIHHVKLQGGELHAVVVTTDKLFEWIAVRRD